MFIDTNFEMVGVNKRPWSSVEGKRTLSTSQGDDDDEGLIEEEPPKSAPPAKELNTRSDSGPSRGSSSVKYSHNPKMGGQSMASTIIGATDGIHFHRETAVEIEVDILAHQVL